MKKNEIIEYIIGQADISDKPVTTIEKIKKGFMRKPLDVLS